MLRGWWGKDIRWLRLCMTRESKKRERSYAKRYIRMVTTSWINFNIEKNNEKGWKLTAPTSCSNHFICKRVLKYCGWVSFTGKRIEYTELLRASLRPADTLTSYNWSMSRMNKIKTFYALKLSIAKSTTCDELPGEADPVTLVRVVIRS